MNARIKSCFITAPAGANLENLRAALKQRDIRILVPEELPIGSDWLGEVSKSISEADLVIGVLTQERRSEWILFELGQAWAVGKQVLVFAPPKSTYLPSNLTRFLTVRANLSNREAIDFALDQLLAMPHREVRQETIQRPRHVLGASADRYLRQVEHAVGSNAHRAIEQILADAFEEAGVEALATSPGNDQGVDLAIWSDALQHYVGNPLLIEIKTRIRSSSEAAEVASRLSKQVMKSGTRWGLLLYADSPSNKVFREALAPNILTMSIPALLQRMRNESFTDIIREMRNRRVHGEAL